MDWGRWWLVGGLLAIWLVAAWDLPRLPHLWRTGILRFRMMSDLNIFQMDVHPRSFLPHVLSCNFLTGGLLVLVSGVIFRITWMEVAGWIIFALTLPAALLHASVNAFNRPRLLVPPPLRGEPGWMAELRDRQRGEGAERASLNDLLDG
ncbi:hypothetical protein [Nonomuraea sp. NPDC048826]|uniref:hypothetical protein n=1 Tax=Nonomuraea sp. NPDC048826 TaxID=3364347 RepID=UPI003711FAEF